MKDGKNGFVVKPQDSKVLADAIQRLLDDKNARHTMEQKEDGCSRSDLQWCILKTT